MIEPHVHCCMPGCECAIATRVKGEDGKLRPAQIHVVQEKRLSLVPPQVPGQPAQIVEESLPRPICDSCHKALEKREREQAVLAGSKGRILRATPDALRKIQAIHQNGRGGRA
jgi:hypothetical protein